MEIQPSSGKQGVRRIVIGASKPRWRTFEVITIRRKRGRGVFKMCRECKRPILPGENYYSDKLLSKNPYGWKTGWYRHQRTYHYGPYYDLLPRSRFYYHIICERCWRGERLDPHGKLTKFVDRAEPVGHKIIFSPFEAR